MGVAIRVMGLFLSQADGATLRLPAIDGRTNTWPLSELSGSQRGHQEMSGAIDGRADWRHGGECACATKQPAWARRLRRESGASEVAGYPSRVLPEPDVDKWRLSLCPVSEDSREFEVKEPI
jgi:hypothetical protein